MPSKKRTSTKRAREESEESNTSVEQETTTVVTTTTTTTSTSPSKTAKKGGARTETTTAATEAIEEPIFDDAAAMLPIKASIGVADARRSDRTEVILNPTEIKIDAGKVLAWQGTFKGVRIALDGQEGDVYCTATVSVMLPPRK